MPLNPTQPGLNTPRNYVEQPIQELPTQRSGLTDMISSGGSMMSQVPGFATKLKGATPYALGGAAASLLGNAVGGKVGGFLGGAGSGAAMGATIGSVVPGIGTAIGAGIGGLVGGIKSLFGGKKKQATPQPQLTQAASTSPEFLSRFDKYVYGNPTTSAPVTPRPALTGQGQAYWAQRSAQAGQRTPAQGGTNGMTVPGVITPQGVRRTS